MCLYLFVFCRSSGVADHYAHNDEHALEIARSIVANLNWKQTSDVNNSEVFIHIHDIH